jgi:hypothetical protein
VVVVWRYIWTTRNKTNITDYACFRKFGFQNQCCFVNVVNPSNLVLFKGRLAVVVHFGVIEELCLTECSVSFLHRYHFILGQLKSMLNIVTVACIIILLSCTRGWSLVVTLLVCCSEASASIIGRGPGVVLNLSLFSSVIHENVKTVSWYRYENLYRDVLWCQPTHRSI